MTLPSSTFTPTETFGAPLVSSSAARAELARLAAGLALSSVYGLALGARAGQEALLVHALGVPLSLLSVGVILFPSLSVLFALLDAPLTLAVVFAALGRAIASSALVLAGMAPGTALLTVTVESFDLAVLVAGLGCLLAGSIGLLQLVVSLRTLLDGVARPVWLKSQALLVGYSIFALFLGARVFSLLVPVLGGES